MAQPLPTHLRSRRRKWALTQRELAQLIDGVSASAISKYETLASTPSLEVMLALEIVFGELSRDLFPALSLRIRRAVVRNAGKLRERLADYTDARSIRKRALLDELITRSHQAYEDRS